MSYSLDFPYAYGKPAHSAILKSTPADFVVDEVFDSSLGGEGEHLYLHLRKTGENTQFLADAIANYFDIKKMDVGFAGMKDRQAITTQWFSCYLPKHAGKFDEAQFKDASGLNIQLLQQVRHTQKLRRGAHQGNAFEICLRDIAENSETEDRLHTIKNLGVPNYFGSQRFGRDGSNLVQFEQKVERELAQVKNDTSKKRRNKKGGRNTHSMLISAARSYLFNLVLAERVRQGNWQSAIEGEATVEGVASAPLWGRGRGLASGEAEALETSALASYQAWCNSLEHSGLSQERRALRLQPQNLEWQWQNGALNVSFQLRPSEYATSVMRELVLS